MGWVQINSINPFLLVCYKILPLSTLSFIYFFQALSLDATLFFFQSFSLTLSLSFHSLCLLDPNWSLIFGASLPSLTHSHFFTLSAVVSQSIAQHTRWLFPASGALLRHLSLPSTLPPLKFTPNQAQLPAHLCPLPLSNSFLPSLPCPLPLLIFFDLSFKKSENIKKRT